MPKDMIARITDAVLYEGYLLWPYRKSALKNHQRFTFGGVHPPAWEERSAVQTEVLLQGAEQAQVEASVRFLQVVERQALKATAEGALEPVQEMQAGERRWVSWQEARERECHPGPLRFLAGEHQEAVPGGAVRRSWHALRGEVDLSRQRVGPGIWRVKVKVSNTSAWRGQTRDQALKETLCCLHIVLRVQGGQWVSAIDPPAWLCEQAQACRNEGLWPVLVGEEDARDTVLAAPIILPDHPQIAPESPGDLFDSSEIDQMLVLNILAMSEQERREMRDSDPRGRAILERTERLTQQQIMRLHGAVREPGKERWR